MVRYLVKRPTTDGRFYVVAAGLSTDPRPTLTLITGSRFIEVNTGKEYRYDELGVEWYPSTALPSEEETTI